MPKSVEEGESEGRKVSSSLLLAHAASISQ